MKHLKAQISGLQIMAALGLLFEGQAQSRLKLPAYYRDRKAYDVEAVALAVLKRERKKGKAALDAARQRRGAQLALDEILYPWRDMDKGIFYIFGLKYQGNRPIKVRRIGRRAIAVPIIVDDFGGYPNV